jgi:hypothetical protein
VTDRDKRCSLQQFGIKLNSKDPSLSQIVNQPEEKKLATKKRSSLFRRGVGDELKTFYDIDASVLPPSIATPTSSASAFKSNW